MQPHADPQPFSERNMTTSQKTAPRSRRIYKYDVFIIGSMLIRKPETSWLAIKTSLSSSSFLRPSRCSLQPGTAIHVLGRPFSVWRSTQRGSSNDRFQQLEQGAQSLLCAHRTLMRQRTHRSGHIREFMVVIWFAQLMVSITLNIIQLVFMETQYAIYELRNDI